MGKKERYLGIESARGRLGRIATAISRGAVPVILTKRGNPVAVIISIDLYDRVKRDG